MQRQLWQLLGVYLGAVITAAAVFTIAEGRPFVDALWWAFVTATTVGYGDIAPITLAGRTTAIALVHFTAFVVIPGATALIAARLIVNSDAFTHREQEEIKASLSRIQQQLEQKGGR